MKSWLDHEEAMWGDGRIHCLLLPLSVQTVCLHVLGCVWFTCVYVNEDVCVICYVCGICVHVCMGIRVDVCGARGVLGVFLKCCLPCIYSLIG